MSATPSATAPANRGLIAASTMLATLLYTVDMTIANVALPQIQGGLQATRDQVFWVLTSYIIASAIVTPLTGFLAARFGGRMVLLFSVIGFTLFSDAVRPRDFAAGARAVPHIAGCDRRGPCPDLSIGAAQRLRTQGSRPRDRDLVHGRPGGAGARTDTRRLPDGDAELALGVLRQRAGRHPRRHRHREFAIPRESGRRPATFDLFGYVLLALGLGLLQLFVDRGSSQGWFESREILIETGLAIVFLYMFIAHSFTTRHPFLEPALFRDRNFVATSGIMLMVGLLFISTTALLPSYLQQVQGYPVITSGELMVWRGIGMMIAMVVGGRVVRWIDPRILIGSAGAILGLSLWPLAHISLDTTAMTIGVTSFFQGAGMGLTFLSVNVAAFTTLAPELRTEGTVFLTLARNLGSAIGVSRRRGATHAVRRGQSITAGRVLIVTRR